MSDEVEENDGQPGKVNIETTLAVVSNILNSDDFTADVIEQNGWKIEDVLGSQTKLHVAVLFLASRYQWSVELLSRQTDTLKKQVDELQQRLSQMEDDGK